MKFSATRMLITVTLATIGLFFANQSLSQPRVGVGATVAARSMSDHLHIDYSTAHIFRGERLNCRSTIQARANLYAGERTSVHVMGNFTLNRQEDEIRQKFDVGLRYTIPFNPVSLSFGAWEYYYSNSQIKLESKLEINIRLHTFLNPSLSAFYNVGGSRKQKYYELDLMHSVWLNKAKRLLPNCIQNVATGERVQIQELDRHTLKIKPIDKLKFKKTIV